MIATARLGRSLQDLISFLGEGHGAGVDLYLDRQGIEPRRSVNSCATLGLMLSRSSSMCYVATSGSLIRHCLTDPAVLQKGPNRHNNQNEKRPAEHRKRDVDKQRVRPHEHRGWHFTSAAFGGGAALSRALVVGPTRPAA